MSDVNISKYRAQVIRQGSTPASPGFAVAEGQNPVDPSGSGQTHLPVTIATATTGLSITESQILSGAGLVSQYIRGDGSLADFPASTGGGSSVSYYLNGSVSQGTIGGVAYKQLNRTPVFGAGTDFTINADGYIASFITDASDPNKLLIPAGNWNFETYFSASSNGGSPSFYVELYKYDGTTFTLIATSSSAPELIAFGTSLNPYYSTLAVPQTTLALTDRLAIRYYVTHSGRTITLHTEDNHLCQIITTFTTGLTALNGLTAQVQNFAVGTSGTDFAIASATATHTFNLPTASATNRGALSSADWSTFNNKTSNLGTVTSVGLSSATSGVTIGSTPVTTSGTITLAIATASGSQNGLLSSTDWTTFNGKQNALTNPVTGTGTSGQVAYFTGTSAISSESNLFWDATNDRLGIGNASPNAPLTVQSNAGSVAVNLIGRNNVGTDEATILFTDFDSTTRNAVIQGTNSGLTFFYGPSTSLGMRLDGSGNLGLGVTPSAWSLGTAIDIAQGPAILGFVNETYLINNAYYNSGFKYKETSFASMYVQNSTGEHRFFTAPSGTAGNAITFTQAMTLTYGGNLLVGTTSDNGAKLQVSGAGSTAINVSGNGYSIFQSSAHTYTPNNIGLSFGYNRSGGNGESTIVYGAPAAGFNFEIASVLSGTITPRLTITNAGAATFSSSVTAGGALLVSYANARASINSTTITNSSYMSFGNTTTGYVGLDNSAGTDFGNGAYSLNLINGGAYNLNLGTSNVTRLAITSGGLINVAVTGTGRLNLMANPSNNIQMEFFNTVGGSVGSITVVGAGLATAYNTTSDYRLKEDLKEINGIEKLLGIKVYNYQWKGTKERMDGVLAHELAQVLPYAVYGEKDAEKMQGVDYSKLVPIMVKAIQELKQEIDTLKN